MSDTPDSDPTTTDTGGDTASGGAPEQPDTHDPQHLGADAVQAVDPEDGTDAEGRPVDNPTG